MFQQQILSTYFFVSMLENTAHKMCLAIPVLPIFSNAAEYMDT